MLKDVVNRWLGLAGYRITRKGRRLHLGDALVHLRNMGVAPRTVIDIGVAWGTPELYQAFPDPYLLLVEPNESWRGTLETLVRGREGSFEICAAGEAEGTTEFHVCDEEPGSSTQFGDPTATGAGRPAMTVPVKRLDEICRAHGVSGPYLIKIDVQGAELHVLKGAGHVLRESVAVIVESGVLVGAGLPEALDLMTLMRSEGFALYDVVAANYRPLDGALGQLDLVFVPEAGPLRANRAWN